MWKNYVRHLITIVLIGFALFLVGCGANAEKTSIPTPLPPTPTLTPTPLSTFTSLPTATPTPCPETISKPADAIEISLLVPVIGLEWPDNYWTTVVDRFNRAQVCGLDPITEQPLASNAQPIWVVAQAKSAGEAAQGIINAIKGSADDTIEKPTIYVPEFRYWLQWINFQTNQIVVDEKAPATTYSPIIIAIWQSRLAALQSKYPNQPVGWAELIQLFDAPDGWRTYGLDERYAVYYGHADPTKSSAGLATLFSEFYASAMVEGLTGNPPKLGSNIVNDPNVQNHVRRTESLTKHYSSSSGDLRRIVKGPDYLDFVALPENDLITLWDKGFEGDVLSTADPLIALYPKEGVFLHEHPLALLKAPWVSTEQQQAAMIFMNYMLTDPLQRLGMQYGFRPVIPSVAFECSHCSASGIDINPPQNLLPPPPPIVAQAMVDTWQLVKKQSDILLLFDVSDSMNDPVSRAITETVTKLDKAKSAVIGFVKGQSSATRVGLIAFSSTPVRVQELCTLEECRDTLIKQIETLQADGSTALYEGLSDAIDAMTTPPIDETRIRAIVLISDGENTTTCRSNLCQGEKSAIRQALLATQRTRAPLLVIPIAYAYGNDDPSDLDEFAHISGMNSAIQGDVAQIETILAGLGPYFSNAESPQPKLQIALAVNQSGDKQSIGLDQIAGAQYGVVAMNQSNGIHGMLFDSLLIKDTASDTSVAQTELEEAFRQLSQSLTLAIIGPGLSDQMFAITQTLSTMTIPVIGPSTTAPGIPQLGDYVLRVSAPVADYAHYAVRVALEQAKQENQPLQKVAVAYAVDDAFSRAESAILQHTITQTYHLTITSIQLFRTTDVRSTQISGDEFKRQIDAILDENPDLVIVSGLTLDGGSFIKQLRVAGYKGRIIGGNGLNTPHLFPFCQPHCEGIMIAQAYNPELETASNQTFVKIYASEKADDDYPYPTQFTAQAYTAVQIVAAALQALVDNNDVDLWRINLDDPAQVATVREALKNKLLSEMRFQTPLGEIWFDKEGEVHQANFYVAQIIINDDGREQFEMIADCPAAEGDCQLTK